MRLMEGYRVYGVGLRADRRFRIPLWRDSGAAELTLRRCAGKMAEPHAATLAYASPRRTPVGDAVARLHREGDVERLSFAAGASFWLRDDAIEYRARTPEGDELLEVLFLGAVMAYWLERHGTLALHASAVEVPGERAVAFLAAHGGGKTSLAAAFLAAGHRLLTDDLLAVDLAPAGARARAGSPGMRMAPALAAGFGADVTLLDRVHPRMEKRLVPVGTGFGGFQPSSRPLASIYLPRRSGSARAVRIAPVSGAEALKELIRCSWSPYIVEATGLQPDRVERLSRLVEGIPVRRLEYPAGLDRLVEVHAAVVADLSG